MLFSTFIVQIFIAVEVTIRGVVNRKTGMVMNITELKEHMEHAIMKPLDHKNLDIDIEYFKVQVISETKSKTKNKKRTKHLKK